MSYVTAPVMPRLLTRKPSIHFRPCWVLAENGFCHEIVTQCHPRSFITARQHSLLCRALY